MSIPYVVRKRTFTQHGEKKELWFATVKKLQKKSGVTERHLAQKLAKRTGFSEGEVLGIITELTREIGYALSDGYSVTINSFGSLQTAVTSEGFEQPSEITPKQVTLSKLYFRPDKMLVNRIKKKGFNKIPFKYYFPEELLTKEMIEEDKRQEEAGTK